MDYAGLQFAFYVLNPMFLTAAGILATMLGAALVALLIDTISYSRLAVAHMIIFLISSRFFYFYSIPISIAVDILSASFCLLCSIKATGGIFAGLGRARYPFERWVFCCLVTSSVSILLDTIIGEGGRGQRSVVVQSLRRALRGMWIEDEVLRQYEQAVEFFLVLWISYQIAVLIQGQWTRMVEARGRADW